MLYSCETWSLALREEYRLSAFENRILRRIFGPKRDENGEWKRLHNKELYSLYHSPNIVRVIEFIILRCSGHVARMEENRRTLKILTGKPRGNISLGWPIRRWENNIRVDLKERGFNMRKLELFGSGKGLLESSCE